MQKTNPAKWDENKISWALGLWKKSFVLTRNPPPHPPPPPPPAPQMLNGPPLECPGIAQRFKSGGDARAWKAHGHDDVASTYLGGTGDVPSLNIFEFLGLWKGSERNFKLVQIFQIIFWRWLLLFLEKWKKGKFQPQKVPRNIFEKEWNWNYA